MLYLLDHPDNPDNWSTLSEDLQTIHYEDGTTTPLTPAHLLLEMGKYKGYKLSEIDDVWYLNFLKKLSTEKKFDFVTYCLNIRLLEVSK